MGNCALISHSFWLEIVSTMKLLDGFGMFFGINWDCQVNRPWEVCPLFKLNQPIKKKVRSPDSAPNKLALLSLMFPGYSPFPNWSIKSFLARATESKLTKHYFWFWTQAKCQEKKVSKEWFRCWLSLLPSTSSHWALLASCAACAFSSQELSIAFLTFLPTSWAHTTPSNPGSRSTPQALHCFHLRAWFKATLHQWTFFTGSPRALKHLTRGGSSQRKMIFFHWWRLKATSTKHSSK